MNNRERNLLLILVLVALVTSPWWPIWNQNPNDVNELGLERESLRQFQSLQQNQAEIPRLNLGVLDAMNRPFTGAERNLFDFGQAIRQDDFVEEKVEKEEPKQTAADIYQQSMQKQAAEERPKKTNRKLRGYEALGIFDRGDHSFVTILWNDRLFVGTVGTVINEAFRIEEITQTGIEVFGLKGEYQDKIALKKPADPQGE